MPGIFFHFTSFRSHCLSLCFPLFCSSLVSLYFSTEIFTDSLISILLFYDHELESNKKTIKKLNKSQTT